MSDSARRGSGKFRNNSFIVRSLLLQPGVVSIDCRYSVRPVKRGGVESEKYGFRGSVRLEEKRREVSLCFVCD